MKPILTLILTCIVSVRLAQRRKQVAYVPLCDTAAKILFPIYQCILPYNDGYKVIKTHRSGDLGIVGIDAYTLISSIMIVGNSGNDVAITMKKDGKQVAVFNDWNTIEFKMKKAQFHWLNDSTAVFTRK